MRTRSTNVKQLADTTNKPPSDNLRTPEMMSPPGTGPPTDKGTGSARKTGSALDTGTEFDWNTGSAMNAINAANMLDPDPPFLEPYHRTDQPFHNMPGTDPDPPFHDPPGRHDDRELSEPVDAIGLAKALEMEQEGGREREPTIVGESPMRKRQRVYGDRFIPNRVGQDLLSSYNLHHERGSPAVSGRAFKQGPVSGELHVQKTEEANRVYSTLLRAEMFDDEIPQSIIHDANASRSKTPPINLSGYQAPRLTPSTPHKNLFNYSSPNVNPTQNLTPHSGSRRASRGPNVNARSDIYSLSPIKQSSQVMLLSPRKTPREVNKVPYKVLDAPELADDFYLNLVDWGASGVLAVGLGETVYLWNSETGKVEQLCKLEGDQVTSVGWIQRGSHLAVGTSRGHILIYDTVTQRRLRTMTGHTSRVSSMAWNSHILSTGSRDRTILHRDVRSPSQYLTKLLGHKQEVCGLRWNSETGQLASGGNDNKIFVWNGLDDRWLYRWGEAEGGHRAAVKAVAWSPHQRGLLATGGGTADRCIKFWNTVSTAQHSANAALSANRATRDSLDLTSTAELPPINDSDLDGPANAHLLKTHDTGSQVCNLLFSQLTSELVSTHGFSQNAINIWKYPSMQQVVSLTGHTYRVLYLAMSPDGKTIVTGAGDETLRFWNCFGGGPGKKGRASGNLGGFIRQPRIKSANLIKEWQSIR